MFDVTAAQQPLSGGYPDRLSEVFATYHASIRTFIYYRLNRPDWHLAEDLASETFLRLVRDAATVDLGNRTAGLLRTIARRVITDHYRLARNTREEPTDFGDWFEERRLPASLPAEDHAVTHLTTVAMAADTPAPLGVAA
ncbi:RNA polymerase sigma factor [Streptomyces rimosus]|uniref:RNA polymerase sigma factor n=1 Tax=Streptomyces rimosus TaxID=1927 RepID=UPI0037D4076B